MNDIVIDFRIKKEESISKISKVKKRGKFLRLARLIIKKKNVFFWPKESIAYR